MLVTPVSPQNRCEILQNRPDLAAIQGNAMFGLLSIWCRSCRSESGHSWLMIYHIDIRIMIVTRKGFKLHWSRADCYVSTPYVLFLSLSSGNREARPNWRRPISLRSPQRDRLPVSQVSSTRHGYDGVGDRWGRLREDECRTGGAVDCGWDLGQWRTPQLQWWIWWEREREQEQK